MDGRHLESAVQILPTNQLFDEQEHATAEPLRDNGGLWFWLDKQDSLDGRRNMGWSRTAPRPNSGRAVIVRSGMRPFTPLLDVYRSCGPTPNELCREPRPCH